MKYEICRQDARGVEVIATVAQRSFTHLFALAQSDLTIGAAIISLRLGLNDKSPSSFTVRFDDSGYIEYTNANDSRIYWFFRSTEGSTDD